MKNRAILLIVFCVSLSGMRAFGQANESSDKGRVLFLVSVDSNSGGATQSFSLKPVSIYSNLLKSLGYRVEVKSEATQADLFAGLQSGDLAALFWVSHSAKVRSNSIFNLGGGIVDSAGANVESLFQNIHPHIRWIGIIGCESESVLKQIESRNSTDENINKDESSLYIDSFQTKIKGQLALASSLVRFLAREQSHSVRDQIRKSPTGPLLIESSSSLGIACRPGELAFPISIKRISDHPAPEVRVSLDKSVVTVFPASIEKSQSELQKVWVPLRLLKSKNNFTKWTWIVESGLPAGKSSELDLGEFKFSLDTLSFDTQSLESVDTNSRFFKRNTVSRTETNYWKPLLQPSGKKLGKTENVYQLDTDKIARFYIEQVRYIAICP